MTYSLDFRKKVFEVKNREKLTYQQTSNLFRINIRTLFRWEQRIEPCRKHAKHATKIDDSALLAHVEKYPDLQQEERAKYFGVSPSGICRAFKRLGVTYKKNTKAPQSQYRGSYTLSKKNKTAPG